VDQASAGNGVGNTVLTTTGASTNTIVLNANVGVTSNTNTMLFSAGTITGSGTVRGSKVALDSATGVGTALARIHTVADTLAARSGGTGGVFVSELDVVTLANVGAVSNRAGGQAYDLIAGGTISVGTGGVNTVSGSTTLKTTAGNIAIGANDVGNGGTATTLISAGNITGTSGVVHGTDVVLDSGTGVGTSAAARLNTAADTLAARSAGTGGVFVSEAGVVTLANIGGVTNTAGGLAYDLTAGGTITIG